MKLEHWHVQHWRNPPFPPLSKGGRGDLRRQHLCTNPVRFDLAQGQARIACMDQCLRQPQLTADDVRPLN
jgi:hypothetical protein